MWSCEFRELYLSNSSIYDFIKNLNFETPLNLRDSFYGGRTEMFQKYACREDNIEINYYDVCSLYPYICKYGIFPIDHPEIILNQDEMPTDFTNIVGFAKVSILAPTNLRLPLLPMKINNKLIFGLCYECMRISNPDICSHTNEQRTIKGTFTCCEIQKSLELGYQIVKIFELWKYPYTQFDRNTGKGGLFAGYIDQFLKLKQEASGFPSRVTTAEEKEEYIRDMEMR